MFEDSLLWLCRLSCNGVCKYLDQETFSVLALHHDCDINILTFSFKDVDEDLHSQYTTPSPVLCIVFWEDNDGSEVDSEIVSNR